MAETEPTSGGDAVPGPRYVLKVTLRGVRPPVWRRLQLSGATTLKQLHRIIQEAMGWQGYHMYMFRVAGQAYGQPDPELECRSAASVRVAAALPRKGARCVYEYDFGDGWEHTVSVESVSGEPVGGEQVEAVAPVCLGGARACPPEDCGGVPGYARLLEALADPADPEHEDMRAWAGAAFDPERFDAAAVNARLRRLRSLVPKPAGRGSRARAGRDPVPSRAGAARAPDPPEPDGRQVSLQSEPPDGDERQMALLAALAMDALRKKGLGLVGLDVTVLEAAVQAVRSEALSVGLETLAAQRGVKPVATTGRGRRRARGR